jgi:hypothetical protein
VQLVVDAEIFLHQSDAASQQVRGLLGREALLAAAADAVVLAEVAIDGLQRVPGFAGHQVRLLAFGEPLVADDPFVG